MSNIAGTRYMAISGEAIGFIHPTAVIGQPPEHRDYRWGVLKGDFSGFAPMIAKDAIIEAYVTVDSGLETSTYVGSRCLVMKHSHVGHDAFIDSGCNLAPGSLIGGFVQIGRNCKIGMGAMIRPRVRVGENVIVGMGSVVVTDIPDGETWAGNPARPIENKRPKLWTPDEEYDAWMDWYNRWHLTE